MAEDVREKAGAAAGQVASTTREQAKSVAGEAKDQVQDLAGQARTQVREQTHAQQQRAAERLHAMGDELNAMADKSEEPGLASDLAREASRRVHGVARWLEEHEIGDAIDAIRDYARRRPGVFLAGAAIAGVAAGRMTRGMTASGEAGSTGAEGAEAGSTGAQAAHGAPYASPTTTGGVEPVGARPAAAPGSPTGEPFTDTPARDPIPGRETP